MALSGTLTSSDIVDISGQSFVTINDDSAVLANSATLAASETDPVFLALSGSFLTAEADPVFLALSGGLPYIATGGETDPIFLALSGTLPYATDAYVEIISGEVVENRAYTESLSGQLVAHEVYAEIISGDIVTHIADASDPHTASLAQTNLSGTNMQNMGDHAVSGTAFVVGVITHTAGTPPTASNYPHGTIYLQYTE